MPTIGALYYIRGVSRLSGELNSLVSHELEVLPLERRSTP